MEKHRIKEVEKDKTGNRDEIVQKESAEKGKQESGLKECRIMEIQTDNREKGLRSKRGNFIPDKNVMCVG